MNDTTYTAYFWVNGLYLSDKQYGIQTAHCVSDMSLAEYGRDIYRKWANDHKTIIIYNGTNSGTVRRTFEIIKYVVRNMQRVGVEIPHTIFREDEESLDGATTACGFIIPDALREFDWRSYADGMRSSPLDEFLPCLPWGDSLDEEGPVSTKGYFERVTERNALHDEMVARRNDTSRFSDYKDYQYDKFKLAEFSEWMRGQRLA